MMSPLTLTMKLAALFLLAGGPAMLAQQTPKSPAVSTEVQPSGSPQGTTLDRVVAIVNGDVVLESDVDEERRFAAFQPLSSLQGSFSRDRAVERLINRSLILQQARLQATAPIADEEVDKQLMQLRQESPGCKPYHCETEEGWERFVKAQGFTMDELRQRWRERMEVLRYIELRFRGGINITPEEIKAYYDKTLIPAYAEQKVVVPKLSAVSDRIQEVLLQQQVTSLLADWLKALRAQGTVQPVTPGGPIT